MRYKKLYCNVVIVTLYLFAFQVRAEEIGGIIDTCWENHSHVEMSKCVEKKASESAAALQLSESVLLNHLSERNEEPELIGIQKKTFNNGQQAFQVYRKKQCEYYAAMAAGGNAAEDIRLACVAVLNNQRAGQLKWAQQNWK